MKTARSYGDSIGVSLLLMLAAACAVRCNASSVEATPVQVLTEFLEAMVRSGDDVNALRQAYSLLDQGAHTALEKRAHMASTLAGREFRPWEMLAQGRFRIVFSSVQRGGMRAKVDGNRAVVVVTGDDSSQRVDVPMVREKEGWRVKLDIPDIQYGTNSKR
jgi:hypothetical protein